MYQLTVTNIKGFELDCKVFDTEEEAKQYRTYEWGGTDNVIDIMMIDKNGDRSIFDDVDT